VRNTNAAIYFVFLILLGCGGSSNGGGGNNTQPTPTVVSVSLAPSGALALATGATQQLNAKAAYSDGSTKDVTASASWSSSSASVASVSTGGLVTAVGAGTASISATISSVSTSASLTVTPILKSITTAPSAPSISVGATQQFSATAGYSDGSTKDVSGTVAWASSSTTVATVSATGLATAVATGATTITATLSGLSGSSSLTVAAPAITSIAVTPSSASVAVGATQQFTATATYSDGSTKDVTNKSTWASSFPKTATISETGFGTTLSSGVTTISASLSGITGSVPFLATIPIAAPSQLALFGNGSDTHLFTALLSDGTTMSYFGPKDSNGLATGITSLVLTRTNGTSSVAVFDEMGRNTQFHGSGGGTILLSWTSATQASVTAVSPDGKVRLGPTSLSLSQTQNAANRFAPLLKRLRAQQLARPRDQTASPPVTVNVSRCSGRPVETATVLMGVTSSDMKTSVLPSSGQSQPGLYDFDIAGPNPTPGLTVDQACGGLQTVEEAACRINDYAPAVVLALTALAGATGILLPEGVLLEILVDEYSEIIGSACTTLALPSPQNSNQTVFASACQSVGNFIDGYSPNQLTLSPTATLLEGGTFTAPPQVVDGANPSAMFSIDAGDTSDCAISSVIVTPSPATVAISSSLQLTAQAYDGGFSPVAGVFSWATDDSEVATVDGSGQVTGISQGVANIIATEQSSSLKASSAVTVANAVGDRFIFINLGPAVPSSLSVNGVSIGSGVGYGTYEICAVPDNTTLAVTFDVNGPFDNTLPEAILTNFATPLVGLPTHPSTVNIETDNCAYFSDCATFQSTLPDLGPLLNSCVTIPGVNDRPRVSPRR
jgi:uncharacterized protein YjdB